MRKHITRFLAILTLLSNLFGGNMKIHLFAVPQQTVTGFGTSACWWAQMIDDESERQYLAKALFSREGLGLNIYRYNVGGGVNPAKNRIGNRSRQTESFLFFNEESGRYEYDFTRDANAQAMLFEALSCGCVDTVVLFANSPHYSMTVNGEPAGSESGGVTNLDESRYQDFVDYFLTITEYFLSKGVPVKYISPVNEPQWDWGGDWVGQEGCHYSAEQVVRLMELFAEGIAARGLDVKLQTPESGQIGDHDTPYVDALLASETAMSQIGSLAYHSYWTDADVDSKLRFGIRRCQKLAGHSVDMTEWCELPCKHDVADVEAALIMARVMANDFNLARCNSWSSWVAVNEGGTDGEGRRLSDGLFYAAKSDYSAVEPTVRYTAFAHFAKFVPPGSKALTAVPSITEYATDGKYYPFSVAAFRTPEKNTVLVIVNEGDERPVTLPTLLAKHMEVYTTDKARSLEKTYDGSCQRQITVPERSITTVVVQP